MEIGIGERGEDFLALHNMGERERKGSSVHFMA